MKPLFLLLLLTALGNVLYHLGQKSVAPGANPMLTLMAVYAVAFVLAAVAVPFSGGGDAGGASWREQLLSWPVLVMAVGVLLIETGFLLAYRAGGSLQWAGVAVAGLAATVLLPLSVLFFRESFSLPRTLGIVLTLAGLALISRH